MKCASCGRGDLMQAQVRTHQCLACGAITDERTNVLPTQEQGPNLSKVGLPVKELGDIEPVLLAPVLAPEEAVYEEEFDVEESLTHDIDLTTLTAEQLNAIERIVNPEEDDG